MNDVTELKPVLELMNNLEVETTIEPVALQDLTTGRVGYTVRYQGSFDEFYELHAFPFDVQVLDVRAQFLGDDVRFSTAGRLIFCK